MSDVTFELNYETPKPKFVRPEILTHHPIPRAMHGVNPRTIKGIVWWDVKRRVAYATNNYCCWACGEPAGTSTEFPAIEAHEAYDINYEKAEMRLKEIVALCHECHLFVHIGNLMRLYQEKVLPKPYVKRVIESRIKMLEEAKLKPFYFTRRVQLQLRGMSRLGAISRVLDEGYPTPSRPWPLGKLRWHLIFEGEMYYGV